MKVKIGKYKSWVGPYQIAEKLCFWTKRVKDEHGFLRKPDWVHEFGSWLGETKTGEDSVLTKVCKWVEKHRQQHVYVKIDPHDTWSMDHTLAHIVLPMLKQLNATKHGAPFVSDEDVPDNLKSSAAPPKDCEYDLDANHFARWDWVLAEMIFAFESKLDDNWEQQYRTGETDYVFEACEYDELGNVVMSTMVKGPNHTYEVDTVGMQQQQARISNGFVLFGKYYECLWD